MSDNPHVVLDARFNALIFGHTKLEKLWTGARWAEGPAYFPAARHLIFSDIPNDRLLRFNEDDSTVSVFLTQGGHQNGHTVDQQGRLIACEHSGRIVSRYEHDGSKTVLASHYQGKRFNSPNDVVVKSDGSIWFTDPTYGIDSEYEGYVTESEIGGSYVYRIDPATGAVTAVVTDMVKPNGLAFSPDEKLLYIADSGITHDPNCAPDIRVVGLSDFANAYPERLSLGMARRVAIARAFVVKPDILLLDEPFVSLDAENAARLRTLLSDLWTSRPTTTLFVTHDMRDAVELADRILFFSARPARLCREVAVSLPRPRVNMDEAIEKLARELAALTIEGR